MGNLKYNIACQVCHTQCLLEILTKENDIFIRKFCLCEELTYPIYKDSFGYSFRNIVHQKESCKCRIMFRKETVNYCYDCKKDICSLCSKKTQYHKRLTDLNIILNYCHYHFNEEIIGFCKKCIKPICNKCLDYFHKNHEIIYNKDLSLNKDDVNQFKENLENAFNKFIYLIKCKYKENYKLSKNNIFDTYGKDSNISELDLYDYKIAKTLELLKTILDLYNHHKKIIH